MTWFKLDDEGAFHAKVLDAGNEAYGAWCRAGQWSCWRGTDGKIPKAVALSIAPIRIWKRLINARGTSTVGLIEEIDGESFQIHDFLDYNPSATEVSAERARRSELGRHGGRASAARRTGKAKKQPHGQAGGQPHGQPYGSADGEPHGEPHGQAHGQAAPQAKSNPVPVPVPEREDPPVVPQGDRGSSGSPTEDFRLPPSEARLHRQTWIDAYVAGIAAVEPGFTFRPQSFAALERVAAKRLPREFRASSWDWIRREAERFARAVAAKPKVWSSFQPDGFESWWNSRCPTEPDGFQAGRGQVEAPRAVVELQPPDAPAPEDRISEERLAEIRAGKWLPAAKAGGT